MVSYIDYFGINTLAVTHTKVIRQLINCRRHSEMSLCEERKNELIVELKCVVLFGKLMPCESVFQ